MSSSNDRVLFPQLLKSNASNQTLRDPDYEREKEKVRRRSSQNFVAPVCQWNARSDHWNDDTLKMGQQRASQRQLYKTSIIKCVSAPVPFMLTICLITVLLFGTALAEGTQYAVAIIDGERVRVRDDRQPSLYTADYGDCLGGSAINVTRFDAAYYKDNMTINFHLAGETALDNEAIMMYIGVFAYGETRFELTFNPCSANMWSACPVQAGIPIEATGMIPVNQNDVSGIPDIALSIPDFEGQAILRLFSNSSESVIGCFAAQIKNNNTFQQSVAMGPVLGVFTFIAVLSSFATAIYGNDMTVIRKHYAHSLSVLAVFAVWHHIFFSGALSMNWPSVLVAFWSNYAWAGGMIYSECMQNTINNFIGANKGNTSHVGAAGTGVNNPGLGGGYNIQQIYKRDAFPKEVDLQEALSRRTLIDAASGFRYYGRPVKPGLPLPGNYSGFAGTLAQMNIPASNAFMTSLLWLLVLIASIAALIISFKLILEGLSSIKLVQKDYLALFRAHYRRYIVVALLRALFIGFFMLAFLTLFQFSYLASSGPVAVACVVFIVMVLGIASLGGLACYNRFRFGEYTSEPDRLNLEQRMLLKFFPWYRISRESKTPRSEDKVYFGSMPWWTVHPMDECKPIHTDEKYTKSFGWLASRYRRTRWWFFVIWIVYEFIRACLLAGASNQPTFQVFALLTVEIVAFIGMVLLRPFEGQRLNILVLYLLGFSKVVTVGLSAAFDARFALPRIPVTVIGIIIIVVQGLLTIAVMIAIIVSVVTSYMSVMRDRAEIRPKGWNSMRKKYFESMDWKAQDIPSPSPGPRLRSSLAKAEVEAAGSSYFSVNNVQRVPKIEDEDHDFMQEVSQVSLCGQDGLGSLDASPRRYRSQSFRSQDSHSNIPRAARLHPGSWSTIGPGRGRAMSNPTISTPERSASRLTSRSGSSSRLVTRISEEEVPPLPKLSSPRRTTKEEGPRLL